MEFGHVALAGGADVEQGATVALGFGEGAEGLSVELDEGVVLVEHGGVPGFGDQAHQAAFGGFGVGAGDDAEALGDAEMVGVDAERAAAEGGEVCDGSAGFGADAGKLFQPGADFVGAVAGQEIESQ